MPSAPKPKQWVAARNFHHAGRFYAKGQPVTIRRTIDLLSRRGDKWITRAPKAAEVVAEPAPTETNPEGTSNDGS
jgi:hypothetical protein